MLKNKFILLLCSMSASVFLFFAQMISASACNYGCYQPKEPDCLDKL